MDLMKVAFGQSDPKPEPKVELKTAPKVDLKTTPKFVPKAQPKTVPKPEPKVEPKTIAKAQPVDNEKLQLLEQELDQAEHDYLCSTMMLIDAKRRYSLLSNGYERDPENSSKDAVYQASADVADCQARQDAINRNRNSLKKQIADLKGGANSQ